MKKKKNYRIEGTHWNKPVAFRETLWETVAEVQSTSKDAALEEFKKAMYGIGGDEVNILTSEPNNFARYRGLVA